MDDVTLEHWLPGRVFWDAADVEASTVEWLHCDEPRFSEPFLDDTFARLTRRPANVLFRRSTTLDQLEAWAAASPGIAPTGFIFHVSRCGSTLLASLLGKLEGSLVLSEPGPVDSVIRAGDRLGRERQVRLLRATVSALGQRRAPGQDRLFIKLDAWNTRQLPLIREAFPETPWVFLYRDPVEVLVSALRQRGVHTVPGVLAPALFGLTEADAMDSDTYAARVLASIYQAGLEHHHPARGLLLDYADLPDAAWTSVARHFDLSLTGPDGERLLRAAGVNPKRAEVFTPDAAAKREAATQAIRDLADRWMVAPYDQLQRIRVGQLAQSEASGRRSGASTVR